MTCGVGVVKVIIKGDRNTGKTCLFHLLQGSSFIEEYIPTPEIQVPNLTSVFELYIRVLYMDKFALLARVALSRLLLD